MSTQRKFHKSVLAATCGAIALFASSCGGPSSEQREAEAAAKLIFDKLLTRCEDGRVFYSGSDLDLVDIGGRPHHSSDIIELKDTSMAVSAKPLSEADKLNGLHWEGQASMTAALWRARQPNDRQWSRWRDGVNAGKAENFFGNALLGEFGGMGQGGLIVIHMWKVKDNIWAYARGSGTGDVATGQRAKLLDSINVKKADCQAVPTT